MSLARRGRGLGSHMTQEETRQRFRNLATGVFMNDFSYTEIPLSFKTVFHLTAYSYRCCSCSYEFEYLDFISDTGEINETMLQNALQSLTNKQCPHVDSATEDHVKDTIIHGIHIAAALETEEVLQRYHDDVHRTAPVGLFGVSPCYVAILKGKPKSLQTMLDMYPYTREDWALLYWYRSEEDRNTIRCVESSFLEQCVRKNNTELLNTLNSWAIENCSADMDVVNALEFAITHNLLECQDILLQNIKKFVYTVDGTSRYIKDCAVIAIIHNRPTILESLLNVLSALTYTGDYETELSELCEWLPRPECRDVLEVVGIFCEESQLTEDTEHGLVTTLYQYLGDDSDEFVAILMSVPGLKHGLETFINSADEEGHTLLNRCLRYPIAPTIYGDPSPKPKIVKLLLDLGSDINMPFADSETPLKFLLRERVDQDSIYYENLRWTVELLLNENPDFEGQEQAEEGSDSITKLALKLDAALLSQPCAFVTDHPSTMLMNSSVMTYSRHAEGALNFLVPLLIECGYPVNRGDLTGADSESLAPAEYDYIQHVLDRPRGLRLMCRDSLRNHFKGRKIRDFANMIHIPESIKDFILLKNELLMLNG